MIEKIRNPLTRRAAIIRRLIIDGSASVEALAKDQDVSVATVRRDLTVLEEEGSVQRTHGGAVMSVPREADQNFAQREQIDYDAKRIIARNAAAVVEPNCTLFMNDGSTQLALARELVMSQFALTVATPGVNIATTLSENPSVDTYLAGGLVRHKTLATSGDFADLMLSSINADIAFIAAEGFSVNEGLTFSYEADAKIARTMHRKATRTIALITSRKIDKRDRFTAIASNEVDVLITDCQNEQTLNALRDMGVLVIYARNLEDTNVNSYLESA